MTGSVYLQNGKSFGMFLVCSGQYLPKVDQGRTTSGPVTGSWLPKAHWYCLWNPTQLRQQCNMAVWYLLEITPRLTCVTEAVPQSSHQLSMQLFRAGISFLSHNCTSCFEFIRDHFKGRGLNRQNNQALLRLIGYSIHYSQFIWPVKFTTAQDQICASLFVL